MKRLSWALLATTLILSAPLAQAAGEKPQRLPAEKFAALDTNHDGSISRDEAAAAPQLSTHFDEIDVDRDGRVMPAELKAYAKTHRGSKEGKEGKMATFEQLDTNHDGVLTRDEVAANHKMAKRFDVADADHDGRVTAEEARAFKGGAQ
ncbi:MAG TPA: EF-hand domain-containing protein [Ideonella sp.]|nr:EF-hand domain-containing protein [Ideonella sp.]